VQANPYRGYRFPEEIISQCVWLYFNFAVSLRELELMMANRGVQLSYETIRRWCDTFGASYYYCVINKQFQVELFCECFYNADSAAKAVFCLSGESISRSWPCGSPSTTTELLHWIIVAG
jgi:hypothetical protein